MGRQCIDLVLRVAYTVFGGVWWGLGSSPHIDSRGFLTKKCKKRKKRNKMTKFVVKHNEFGNVFTLFTLFLGGKSVKSINI